MIYGIGGMSERRFEKIKWIMRKSIIPFLKNLIHLLNRSSDKKASVKTKAIEIFIIKASELFSYDLVPNGIVWARCFFIIHVVG